MTESFDAKYFWHKAEKERSGDRTHPCRTPRLKEAQ